MVKNEYIIKEFSDNDHQIKAKSNPHSGVKIKDTRYLSKQNQQIEGKQ